MFTVWNNAKGKLSGGLTANASVLVLDSTYTPDGVNYGGNAFWESGISNTETKPTVNSPKYLTLVEYNDQSGTEQTAINSGVIKLENVEVTTITGDILTMTTRGVNETTAQSFSAGSWVYEFVLAEQWGTFAKIYKQLFF